MADECYEEEVGKPAEAPAAPPSPPKSPPPKEPATAVQDYVSGLQQFAANFTEIHIFKVKNDAQLLQKSSSARSSLDYYYYDESNPPPPASEDMVTLWVCRRASEDRTTLQASKDMTTLFLFDVDDALTPLKGNITSDMTEFLKKVAQKVCVGVISGSDTKKLSEQLKGTEGSLNYVFAGNVTGNRKNNHLPVTTSIHDKLGTEKMNTFMEFVLSYISTLRMPVKKGNFVERRNNMIKIFPAGKAASTKDRHMFKHFDEKHHVRRNFISALASEFRDYGLSFNIADDISIEVYPNEWENYSSHLLDLEKENFKMIHFFGDKVNKGGNDYEIYLERRVTGHRVSGPDDTKKQVSELLHL